MMPTESTATRYNIPELNERTTPLDTDLFLLSDASGNGEYKIPLSAVKGGDVATVEETLTYLGIEVNS